MPSYRVVCERMGCGCILAAAVLLAALMVTALRAAPVPRPVERLTPELMPGRWECSWGQTPAWFAFNEDGTYTYGTDLEPKYCGEWSIRGDGSLRLWERSVNGTHWTEYVLCVDTRDYPTIRAKVNGSDVYRVTIRNPKRWED